MGGVYFMCFLHFIHTKISQKVIQKVIKNIHIEKNHAKVYDDLSWI